MRYGSTAGRPWSAATPARSPRRSPIRPRATPSTTADLPSRAAGAGEGHLPPRETCPSPRSAEPAVLDPAVAVDVAVGEAVDVSVARTRPGDVEGLPAVEGA